MDSSKEQWIDDVMQSAKTIGTVESSPFLATGITAKLQQHPIPQVSTRWIYATVAAMTLIFLVNISVWNQTKNADRSNTAVRQLVEEYGWSGHDMYSANSN